MTNTKTDPMQRLRDSLHAENDAIFDPMERLKRKFFPSSREKLLAAAMDELIRNASERPDPDLPHSLLNRSPAKGLVLYGETGVGKSRSIRQFLDRHPVFRGYRDPASDSPMLWVTAPSPCTLLGLGRRILIRSGYRLESDRPAHRLFEMIGTRLNEMGKPFLGIDEFQHVVHATTEDDQIEVADTMKNLMEDQNISLIISGVGTLLPFLQLDDQFDRRVAKLHFPKLEPADHDMLADMVHAFAREVGVEVQYDDNEFLFARLAHASRDALGLSIEVTRAALAVCLRSPNQPLNKEHFATAYAAAKDSPASENPFLADNWEDVKVQTVVIDPEEDGPEPPARRGRKGKKKGGRA